LHVLSLPDTIVRFANFTLIPLTHASLLIVWGRLTLVRRCLPFCRRSGDALLTAADRDSAAAASMPRAALDRGGCDGWRLVITGHSLGAGVAAFVGMHLRTLYREVHVFCFSPPGWLMTPSLAAHTHGYVTSVVINKDFVPR
jgi:Lipase (class 3)